MDDIVLNKIEIIKRCLRRIREEYDGAEDLLPTHFTKQDSILLNLQRACEAAIDLAIRIARIRNLSLPQTSRETFSLLAEKGVISGSLSDRLQKMIGFRNVAVHDYQKIDLEIVVSIIQHRLQDFEEFVAIAEKNA